jgi:homoserine O-acetyltransferase
MTMTSKHRTVQTEFFTFADTPGDTFLLEDGQPFGPVTLAYETYGQLTPERDNAILVFHAMTGSQHAAGFNPAVPGVEARWNDECQTGWWDSMIGPNRALDTREFFVICVNYLGGCYGSTGPASIDPATGKPYGGNFPVLTCGDVVNSQARLLDHLGIQTLVATIGGSLGGVLAMEFGLRYPDRVRCVIPVAAGPKATTLHRLHNFEQIFAIEEDRHFNYGDYYDGPAPRMGLILARMIAHKSFVHLELMEERSKREIVQAENDLKGYKLKYQIESYMLHQGKKFVDRFDANSYLRILSMWQQFDLANVAGGDLVAAFTPCRHQRYLVFSIDCDVCFWPEQQGELCDALKAAAVPYQHITVHSFKGHDSFLLEPEMYRPHIHFMLRDVYEASKAS